MHSATQRLAASEEIATLLLKGGRQRTGIIFLVSCLIKLVFKCYSEAFTTL